MSQINDTIYVISSFSGFPLRQILSQERSSDAESFENLNPSLLKDQNTCESHIQEIWNRGKTPLLLSNVEDAFSISNEVPSEFIHYVFVAPDSIENYCNVLEKNAKSETEIIENLQLAEQECDLLWKYDSIISPEDLKSISSLSRIADLNSIPEHFDILHFKETLSDCLSRAMDPDSSET